MKRNWMISILVVGCLMVIACRHKTPERYDPQQSYERFINSHVFAKCEAVNTPYARYSLAKVLKRPENDVDYYKVQFVNGPCKGVAVWTRDLVLKTAPVEDVDIPTGTVVLRNFDNPKDPFNKEITDHWNAAVVLSTERANKGILDLGFPRDRNDFFPARESIYIHNIRLIKKPILKDIRQFIK